MKRSITALVAGSLLAVSFAVFAGPGAIEGVQKQPVNFSAIAMFMIFVLATLGITKWAAGKTKTAADFYTAGGGITGFQNGLAIAGDYMSAASFLGISGLVFANGFDGLIFSIGWLVGWPVITFLMAERLRLASANAAATADRVLAEERMRSVMGRFTLLLMLAYTLYTWVQAFGDAG